MSSHKDSHSRRRRKFRTAGNGKVEPQALQVCDDHGLLASVDAAQRYQDSRWKPADWLRYFAYGQRPEPIPSYSGVVETPRAGKVGIACSGGGIRSAAFSLGALQALEKEQVLQKSCYLAGVSGGAYIAAAFCMVRKRWSGEHRPTKGEPGWDDSDPRVVNDEHPPFFSGSPEEQYLRNRCSYLAPGTLGKIKLGYRLVLGMAVNLGFMALFLVALAIPLGIAYGAIYPSLTQHVAGDGLCHRAACNFTPLHQEPWVYWPHVAVAGFALLLGASAMVAYRMKPRVRDAGEAMSVRLLIVSLAGGAVFIGMPTLLAVVRAWGTAKTSTPLEPPTADNAVAQTVGVGAGGVATVGAAIILHLRSEWVEAKKVAQQVQSAAKWYGKLGQQLRRILAYVLAAIVGPALALLLMLVAMSSVLNIVDPGVRWIVCGAAAALFAIVYVTADLTTWSLHPFYRRRLCTAFALKRVKGRDDRAPIARDAAGVANERDYNRLVTLSDTAIEPGEDGRPEWPTLLVCAAANVSDNAATPPGRGVTSFTFSPTAIGGPLVGAVKTTDLEDGLDDCRRSAFTLPAAVAMSGAALSPSMGKMTRRPLTFLLALANVRLGVWVPNPRRLKTFNEGFVPRPRPSYLLRELFGSSPVNAPFLYVTDGGHYENLGVVELLRRGCTEIYSFDASNDHGDALGDAVSLARSELGVEIEIDWKALDPDRKTGLSTKDWVAGTIRYPGANAATGTLYYARPVMTADAPSDVVAYHAQDKRFPHDPSADQLYTDQRFEAYRALGARAGERVVEASMQPSGGGDGAVPTSALVGA